MRHLVILAVFLLAGCSGGHPVPSEAFRACSETGGSPIYVSDLNATTFSCKYDNKKV